MSKNIVVNKATQMFGWMFNFIIMGTLLFRSQREQKLNSD